MNKCLVKLFYFLLIANFTLATPEAYCDRNETHTIRVPVTKTRSINTKRTFFKPSTWFKPTTSRTEEYEEMVEQKTFKIVSACCPGYNMSELQLCEPVCEHSCPSFASCVEPNKCQCKPNYISAISLLDGHTYCEPICEPACGSGSHCAEPGVCACNEGYRSLEDGTGNCEPLCKLGDGCENGKCIAYEECLCNRGYVRDYDEQRCVEKTTNDNADDDDDDVDETNIEEMPSHIGSVNKDNDDNDDDVDDSSTAFNIITTVLPSDTMTTSPKTITCTPGYLLYKGECRPEFFSSESDADCRFNNTCGPNQFCTETGYCNCIDGYVATKSNELVAEESNENATTNQLSMNQPLICRLNLASNSEYNKNKLPWKYIAINIIASLGILAFIVGVTMLLFRIFDSHGRLDVEANTKANMTVEYSNRISDSNNYVA